MNKIVVDKIYDRYCKEYGPLNTEEEKQELYIIANALAFNQLNHLFKLKPKHMRIYLEYLGVYNNGTPQTISEISLTEGLVEASIKRIIKKVQKIETKYISSQLAPIYAKNYYFSRIDFINSLNLNEIELILLYKMKINNIENIICNTKEEFFQKLMTFNFDNINIESRKKLYEKIYDIIMKFNLGFIDELEDNDPLKEYLTLNNQIKNNWTDIHNIRETLIKLETLKNQLDKYLYYYKNSILDSKTQVEFYYPDSNISNMNEEAYEKFLKEKIKELEKIIDEYNNLINQKYASNEEYHDKRDDIVQKERTNKKINIRKKI